MNTASRAIVSGSLAGMAAAAMLAACARQERRGAVQPVNATSHWLHGDAAAAVPGVDWRHTGVGYATHHAAAFMWAILFEKLRQRSGDPNGSAVVRDAAVASAVAAAVDYTITPHRLTPGWELVLSKRSMALAYVAMAAGFVAAEYLLPPRDERSAPREPVDGLRSPILR